MREGSATRHSLDTPTQPAPAGRPDATSTQRQPNRAETNNDPRLSPSGGQLDAVANEFAMLAAPTRLRLMCQLAQRDQDVAHLARAVGASVPTVSHHLAKLRLAGMVTARREGRHRVYHATNPALAALIERMIDTTASH